MIAGLRGSLLSHDAIEALWTGGSRGEPPASAVRQVAVIRTLLAREAGPTWSARSVLDRIATPLLRSFGLDVVVTATGPDVCRGYVRQDNRTVAALVAFGWGRDAVSGWRDGIRVGMAVGVRWCCSFTGPAVVVYDAERTHSRRFAEIDLAATGQHDSTLKLLWQMLHANGPAAGIDAVVVASERHRAAVRTCLQLGVQEALQHLLCAFAGAAKRTREPLAATAFMDESLVIVYRVLFLLFAEARGLVPRWHPVYDESYTIEALRRPIEARAPVAGLWEALQAIARLAHQGCRSGTLRVPPFNGPLFSPSQAPLADTVPLDDGSVRNALLALTTRRTPAGRQRITYGDLGVEHLGGVYERVLDFDVRWDNRRPSLVHGHRRKSSGSFYTPRSLTEYLVRRTLAPLVNGAAPEEILNLRVLDPAMGSGAFLVAACRYLAAAYESALIAHGLTSPEEITDADRAAFRRLIARRTLFGVDLNPMAVQLSRLSLWLTTLAGDRPLTFFDHHLRTGNSLAGASLADVVHRRSGAARPASATLPLFDGDALSDTLRTIVSERHVLTEGLEDTLDHVRSKEAVFARIRSPEGALGRCMAAASLWCAGWFDHEGTPPDRAVLAALVDSVLGKREALPARTVRELLARGQQESRERLFFHWELEFPEIFRAADGSPLEQPGFDAIVGNPPWEVLRGDRGRPDERAWASDAGASLTRFARSSGIYRLQGKGHANLYQLFVERSLSLVRESGRVGLVLPSGLATDHGSSELRRHLLLRTTVDSCVVADNREGLFPIHRGLKFLLVTLTRCGSTSVLPLRTGVTAAADFDRFPDTGPDAEAVPVPVGIIEQLSGVQMAIPDLRSRRDLEIVGRIATRIPPASDASGWGLSFGRELNATDDRAYFRRTGDGLPVLEGKHIQPFAVDLTSAHYVIRRSDALRITGRDDFERPRVAYRDVASATNRLTLIAAVLPAGVITTHTLFCLRTPLDLDAQHAVAGLLNSFVANYLVRLRVATHVTVTIVERLPLPKPSRDSDEFSRLVELSRAAAVEPGDEMLQAPLQALVARLYRLDAGGFEHVLSTFPLVDEGLRRAALSEFLRTL